MRVEAGYRPNVGMIVVNDQQQVLWAKRHGIEAWQFPQGGIRVHETPLQAMFRELDEEVGLLSSDVEVLGETQEWVSYRFGHEKKTAAGETYIGQRQKWFLLKLIGPETHVRLDAHPGEHQEFESWRWVDYWYPVEHIVAFKKKVYETVLQELSPLLFQDKAAR